MTGTVLFNPYTGKPRHPSDIESDPSGLLIVEPDAPLLAALPCATRTYCSATCQVLECSRQCAVTLGVKNLPELPDSEWHPWGAPVYTADQMREYALAALAAHGR